jgi:hypothetical protein
MALSREDRERRNARALYVLGIVGLAIVGYFGMVPPWH